MTNFDFYSHTYAATTTDKSLSEALIFPEHGENTLCK